jgi:hypothetical protein
MCKLLIWALLVVVPVTSLRVVCMDAPAEVSVRESGGSETAHCREMCARIKAAASGSNCAVTAASLVLLEAALIGLPPVQPVLRVHHVAVLFNPDHSDAYLAPELNRQSPPPKA